MDVTSDTRQAVMAAAAQAFAEQGFEAASLRLITRDAGANLAAVNYHFGSKDGLIAAVIGEMVAPINAERLRRLDALEATSTCDLEAVLRALIEPMFGAMADPDAARIALALVARIHQDPQRLEAVIQQHFRSVLERFVAALMRCAPSLPAATVVQRLQFTVGAALNALTRLEQGGSPCSEQPAGSDRAAWLRTTSAELIAFAAAGFAAAPAEGQA